MVPSYEAKRKLLSHPVDNSHISNDQFCWPFSIPSSTSASSSSESSLADSPLGHQSSNGHSTGSDQRFQLLVTIYRRGCLNPNVAFVVTIPCHKRSLTLCFDFRMRQKIHFIHPPEPSMWSSLTPVSVSLPKDPPAILPAVTSWKEQRFPPVLSRGDMFGQTPVEVECEVSNKYQITMSVVQLSLPRSSLHPCVIPAYHFCCAFVHLHMVSSDFLPCRRHHPSLSHSHQRKSSRTRPVGRIPHY